MATAAAKKTPAAKPAAKAAAKPAAKKAAGGAFMKPQTLSKELGAIIGTAPQPRTEVTKKVWEYIKKHNLQDSANKRMINADDKLKVVFGGKAQVSMFEMTKLLSAHMSAAA